MIPQIEMAAHEVPLLEELRAAINEQSLENETLLRFLRAREHNVKRAEEMLRKHLEWRESNNFDSIEKWEIPSELLKEFRLYFSGLDQDGFPVYIIPLGRWDGRKVLGKGYKEDTIRFMYRTIAIIMAKCRALGKSKFTILIDNDGLTVWKCAHWDSIECAIRVIRDFESNFPETLLSAYLVNTPTVFWQAFKFVKPVLAGNTLEKIHIFDSDKDKWTLFNHIPKKSLPNGYGGIGIGTDLFLAGSC